jgi:hypothetical protein
VIKDSDGPIHILDAKKPMRLELRVIPPPPLPPSQPFFLEDTPYPVQVKTETEGAKPERCISISLAHALKADKCADAPQPPSTDD